MTIIGLDTDRTPLRMVCAAGDDGDPSPFVTEHRTFRSLGGFQRYWKRHLSSLPDIRVALPASTEDPLGVFPWLETQDVPIETFPWLGYRVHLSADFDLWGLPEPFEGAYVLALYASYRANAGRVASDLWAELAKLIYTLDEIRHKAHRLTAALARAGPPDAVEDIPF